jgi:hypothetical protein
MVESVKNLGISKRKRGGGGKPAMVHHSLVRKLHIDFQAGKPEKNIKWL